MRVTSITLLTLICAIGGYVLYVIYYWCHSNTTILYRTKLDAEKRLALQEEKQALETKLLEV